METPGVLLNKIETTLKPAETLEDSGPMGHNPVPAVNIPIPTKIGSEMGGEFTYPKMGSRLTVLNRGRTFQLAHLLTGRAASALSARIRIRRIPSEPVALSPVHPGFVGGRSVAT